MIDAIPYFVRFKHSFFLLKQHKVDNIIYIKNRHTFTTQRYGLLSSYIQQIPGFTIEYWMRYEIVRSNEYLAKKQGLQ